MESKLSKVGRALKPSPIQDLSHLAQRCNAINLAEGFPDFPAPHNIKAAAISAIDSDFNQYRHVQGICDCLANLMKQKHGLDIDPLTDVAICCGQTEAFAATVFATIDQGDEVLLFDPAYETYETCITIAGGIPVYVALDPPHWTLNPHEFLKSFTARTKAIVLNSPHNPTGKVFTKDELEVIAGACRDKDCLVITDEVYEYITFDMRKHSSIASLPGMQERTIITSSLSKTYSVTGWRIGWAIAPAIIASAIRNIHVKIVDSAPAPFQEAALTALTSPPDFFESFRMDYEMKRDYIVKMLVEVGFQIQFKPQGSFFVFAELPENCKLSDQGAERTNTGQDDEKGKATLKTHTKAKQKTLNRHKRQAPARSQADLTDQHHPNYDLASIDPKPHQISDRLHDHPHRLIFTLECPPISLEPYVPNNGKGSRLPVVTYLALKPD